MSLKNIGNILESGQDFTKLVQAVNEIGNIEDASKALNSVNKLTDSLKTAVLVGSDLDVIDDKAAKAALGISDVGTAAAQSASQTSGLGTAFKGLWGIIKTHPIISIGTALAGVGTIAYTVYKNIKDGYIETATSATSTWESSKSSLEDYISKYKDLKAQLDSGDLSEAETISVKQQILDIQNQIVSAYGEQASGIDLVNGKLDTQLAKIQSISQEEAQRNINENRSAYEDAEHEMNKDRSYTLGALGSINSKGEFYTSVENDVADLLDKYEGLSLLPDGWGNYKITFTGDASQAYEVINDFESDVEELKSKYGEDDGLINSILKTSSSALNKNQKVLDDYQENYRSFLEQEAYSKGYGDELSNYAKAIDDYNTALMSGDISKIQEARQAFNEANEAKEKLLSQDGNSDYSVLFDDLTDSLDKATIKYNDFQEALTSDSLTDDNQFKNQADAISKASDELKKLGLNAVDVADALMTDGFQAGEDQIRRLAVAWGWTVDSTAEDAQTFSDTLVDAGIVIGDVVSEINSLADSADGIDSLTESANTLVSSITSINSALASQTTGTSISTDIFEDESLKDYASALEYVNKCYQLNEDKVKEITKAKVDEQIATNDAKKALEQQDYLKNAAEIDTLRAKLEAKNFAENESAESIQAQINSLLESNSAIIANCNQLDVLNASLRESIGVYQQWKDAQSAGNSGDMFDDAGTAWSQIRDIADKDSDMYGRVGTVQYQAAVDFLVPENIDHSDQEAVQKYLDSVKKYMYFDDDGNVNGLNMDNFFQDAVKKGLMIETDDSYEIAGQMTMEKFAEGMGMSLPLVQAMFGEIEEFMPEGEKWFDWSDEAVQSLGDLAVVASDAADALQATDSFKDIDIKLDISDLETTEEKISSLDSTIAQMNQVKATPGVDTSQIEDANAIIQYCVQQKQALNEPAVMSVDTSMVEGQIGNAISLLQQFQQAQNELEMQKSLGLDTSEAEGKVASLTNEIQGLKPNITAALNIDTSSAESIASSIASLTPEMMVTAGIDDTAIIGYTPEDKDAKVTYSVDHSAVDAYNPKDLSRKVTYTIVTEGNAPSGGTFSSSKSSSKKGSTKLNGTAHAGGNFKFQHAYGMALANGVWGAKQGGMTLVGELGREIVVDPYTGKWHTVGDNGAEFTNIPKGAIVFNHLQSEELLKNGYVSSRAQAMVSGTAFVSGNAMVTGKVPKRVSATRNNNQKTTEAKFSNTSQNKNTTATNKNTKATEDNTKAQENLQDWIERQIDRLTRNLDSIRDRIDNLEISRNQNAEIDKFISQASQNIQTLNASADYYMQKANALGLDGSYVSKIVQGTIQIEDIQDEDLRDKIQKYQDWYDKAVNLRDEIKSINKEINDMKISKLENIQNDYENLQKYHQSMVDINDAYSELSEKMNGVGNLAHLQNNLDQNKQMKAYYEAQAKEMQSMLDKLTAEGVIGLHSDTWLQWQTEINNVKKSIVECDEALIELKDSIRTVRLKQFSDMVEELEHASDILSSIRSLMSEEGIFDNDIKFTESGYAQLGIMAQELVNAKQLVANYNVAIEALNKDLKNGNITQNDYNQTLKEYEKSQMDAVKATKDAKEAILDVIRNGIEKQTEAMEKLIQKRKDDLSVQKEYYDFQKKMADQSKEMNKIRAQIAVLEGDDSLEAQSKVRKLQSQLQELQDQYNEDIKDHEYDVVQDAYDETLDKFKKNQEETLHELETNLDAQNKAIADTLSLVKDNYSSVYNELNTMATEYGFKLSEAVTQPWEDANAALNLYLDSINKLSGNVNIDTGKIQSNYTPVNTANKVGTEASTATSKNAGNWIKQGDRWWYQHTDGSYTKNGWEQIKGKWYKFDQEGWMQTGWQAWGTDSTGQTAWYYMNPDGSMATSQWIDDKYYVDSSGVMARNGYVKSKNGDTYYWVNNDGVWESQWDTQNPDLDKYKVYYNRGTKSAKSGLAYLDDDENHRLDMGSEIIITEKGLLRQMDAGDMVFNKNQKKVLYDISNGELPYNWTSSILNLPEYSRQLSNMIQPKNIGGGNTVNYNMHYDTLMTVNGNVTNERFMKNICKESFDYTVSELKKYSKRI